MRKGTVGILTDHTYLPDRVGGRESSLHELAIELRSIGWTPTVVARQSHKPKPFPFLSRERHLPRYVILRDEKPIGRFLDLVERGGFDRSIVNVDNVELPGLIDRLNERSIVCCRDVQNMQCLADCSGIGRLAFVANSSFVASTFERVTGQRALVAPPFIRERRYRGLASGKYVTFVNPVPQKGLEVAIAVAKRLPHIPFLFLEAWPLDDAAWNSVRDACRPFPNITLRRSSLDMRSVYARTRILLVPSQWLEAWGRVVTEAQFNAIPSIASDSGGLPESVGAGGIVLPRSAPAEEWAATVQGLYEDQARWRRFSTLAWSQSRDYVSYRDQRYGDLWRLIAELGDLPLKTGPWAG